MALQNSEVLSVQPDVPWLYQQSESICTSTLTDPYSELHKLLIRAKTWQSRPHFLIVCERHFILSFLSV